MTKLDPWYLDHLVCPVDGGLLAFDGRQLVSTAGRLYPVVDGIPVMLLADRAQTIRTAKVSMERARGEFEGADLRLPHMYIDTLGLSSTERDRLVDIAGAGSGIDPVVLLRLRRTSGNAYRHLVGDVTLRTYPIPRFSLRAGRGRGLLDVGCNWGRWSIAAARADFRVVGLDPSLGAILAARRVARELGHDVKYVVGDARWLPFPPMAFDVVYSYSVLQHFAKDAARQAAAEAGRVLRPGGIAHIQMANRAGVRSIQQRASRRFREPIRFEVRYWSLRELREMFEVAIGPTSISADCYFGLGWQWEDRRFMPTLNKIVLAGSELLKRTSRRFPPLLRIADSVFCTALRA